MTTLQERAREAVAELTATATLLAVASDNGPFSQEIAEYAALITELAKAVPRDGWKLVPVEPTDRMLEVALVSLAESTGEPLAHIVRDPLFAYRAMLAAAPLPPSPEEDERT
jgi:hypothetical protein